MLTTTSLVHSLVEDPADPWPRPAALYPSSVVARLHFFQETVVQNEATQSKKKSVCLLGFMLKLKKFPSKGWERKSQPGTQNS